jgi:hypothetical protein
MSCKHHLKAWLDIRRSNVIGKLFKTELFLHSTESVIIRDLCRHLQAQHPQVIYNTAIFTPNHTSDSDPKHPQALTPRAALNASAAAWPVARAVFY